MAGEAGSTANASDCIFCLIVKGTIPAMKVFENEQALAFLDIYPIAKGHTLVAPKAHFRDVSGTPPDQWRAVMDAVHRLVPKVKEAMGADGINVGVNVERAAGQAVFHVHAHIIPRWTDDGLRMWPNKSYGKNEIAEIQEKIAKMTGYAG